ncbi:hypothetical protein [Leptolyngbya sp. Heron Island J]|uniref:hypothetical protein n=1 Tax=Leptolyngbya sp. Heron Island J TaxID=1385935 RepID=UPI0003FA365B|nr:hypothetical protein [Leptolyngbya sp. Heron Island J]
MQYIDCMRVGVTPLILGISLWLGQPLRVVAQTPHSGCYIEAEDGAVYDLGLLCVVPDESTVEPTLQTGDVQVTLRWNTSDDLDLIVIDPAGDIVDFGSPTSPSGGQLDVDANGFCQTQNFSPVENIFWPMGAAPDGQYVAYVTLAIPCSLESLASTDVTAANNAYASLTVPYTLTILNQGETTTYEGFSRPETFGADYSFQVGPATSDEPILEQPQDSLELPNFGLPAL